MKKENKLFIIYLFLIIVITTVSAATITNKNNEIIKLEKINKDLNEKIKDYEWQIAQVPYVIESWCKGE